MLVGITKERKNGEFRVAATPAGVKALTGAGHKVFVEKAAGEGSGTSDGEFCKARAEITRDRKRLFDVSGKVPCVKKPLGMCELLTNNPIELTPILCSYPTHAENGIVARFFVEVGLNFGVHIGVYDWYKKG